MILPYPFRDRYLYITAIATTIPIINNNNNIAPTVAPAIIATLEFSGSPGLTRAQRLAESNGCVLSEMTKLLSPTLIPEEFNSFRPL